MASNLSFVTQMRSPRYRREGSYSQTESRINTFPCGLYSHHSWNCSRNKNYTPVSLPSSISYLCKICNFKIKIFVNISFVCISQLSPQSSSSRKNFKIFIFLYVCVHAACLPACLCAWQRHQISLELESQEVVNCLKWVLGHRSSMCS